MNEKLPLPPFGRILLAYQEQKVRLNFHISIYIGKEAKEHSFQEMKDGFITTFLPYGQSASAYSWPVFDQKLLVIDTGGIEYMQAMNTCLAILRHDPRVMFFYSDTHRNQMFLPKGRKYDE